MFDLSGKTALVTGASGGIGAAIATALVGQGARVGLSGTRVDALQAVAAPLGERAVVIPGDLAGSGGAEALIQAAIAQVGGVDILVNNAGLTRDNLAMRLSDEDWQIVLDVNLTAGFKLIRALMRGMIKKRWGRIINISSVVAATGNPGQVNYAASKAGMIGMTKALAHELSGRGITANCVAPGFIETAMTKGLPAVRRDKLLESIPAGRLGTPADIAACVIFLASGEAAYVTGQTLHVNGGMAMI